MVTIFLFFSINIDCIINNSSYLRYKLVPQGRDQVAKLPLFVRTQTHSFEKSQ